MFNLGVGEIAVILVVALLFVGPKMLPEIASGLGKIIREIRKATADIRQDIELDDIIRKPLQELRDAATLPPEELKRRDEARAAQRKAAEESRRQRAAQEDEHRKLREAEEAEANKKQEAATAAEAARAVAPPPASPEPIEVITAGGTMILNPPPAGMVETMTPLVELLTPEPIVSATPPPRLPLPPPPPPPLPRTPGKAAPVPADATVLDLGAQAKAVAAANPKAPVSPAALATKTLQTRLGLGKPGTKKG